MRPALVASLEVVLRLILGGMLLYAGFSKLNDGWKFAEAIANYDLFPTQLNQLAAVVLPWWELALGGLLVFGLWTRAAALSSAVLFAALTIAVVSALARGLDIECGCFSDTSSKLGVKTLAIDVVGLTAALALTVLLSQVRPASATALQP